ncbi:hypothetical protein GW17_00028385 [Ensete ventricosum]|nr:hypothetical protein GW17_00028385 [Ensete ventricosum]
MVEGQQWSVSINVGMALEGDAGSIVSYGGIVAVAAGSCGRGGHDRGLGLRRGGHSWERQGRYRATTTNRWSNRMGHGWAAKSSDDRYGRWRKMKKLREVATAGSAAAGKGSRRGGKEEGSMVLVWPRQRQSLLGKRRKKATEAIVTA